MKYHAVMIDETGCEFGADCEAATREAAIAHFRENYPESRIDQIETSDEAAERERRTYDFISRGGDYDDEGRPFYHYDYDDDDCDDMEDEQ